jgi:hypothetical protein
MGKRKWHKVILAVFLVVASGISVWYASPAKALNIVYTDPYPIYIARPVQFQIDVNIVAPELLPISNIDLSIYSTSDPFYTATCDNLPLSTGPKHYDDTDTGGGGVVDIDAVIPLSEWGYGYIDWEGTPHSFGYGYGYRGTITYTVTWTSPAGWLPGEYEAELVINANGSSFSETKTFTLTQMAGGGGGFGSQDRTPPRISDIVLCQVDKTTADICWKTHEKSTSQVRYRASPEMLSELDEEMVIEHLVHLTGLTPATTYYYVTMSRDKSGNLGESDELTFTTMGVPANFDFRSLSIIPEEVEIGDTVTISAVVFNIGDGPGTYEVILNIDGTAVDSEEVTLDGGTSQRVTFTVSRDAAATYSVGIGSLSGLFVVSPAPPPPPTTTPDEEEPEIPVEEPEMPVEEEEPTPINWWLIGGVIAAIIAATTVVWLTFVRQRA